MKKIKTVGVVGAGTMGSALAQKLAQEGFNVILADREMRFVDKGLNGIKETLNQGVERRLFTPEQVSYFMSNIKGTATLNDLSVCDLIIEAIFEDFNAKQDLFKSLSDIIPAETIIATNTSSFSVSELAKAVTKPERFIGMHYFYHAAKNRLVEIIPGEKTTDETYKAMKVFSVQSGKDAITTKDSYGFAVNRFFVPWLNEAVRLLEDDVAKPDVIDNVCMKLFGIGMGPFALMNATGVPIAYHAQKTLEVFGDFYKVAGLLKEQAESGKNWEIEEPAEHQEVNADAEDVIRKRMLGAVFFVCSQILDEKVCSATDLNRGARIGLRWRKGPVDLMQRSGEDEVTKLVKMVVEKYNAEMPSSINKNKWEIEYVQLEKAGSRAIISMARPEDMNALNEIVMKQLTEKFDDAESDDSIDTIFITGLGKAFVAGADIKFFIRNIKQNDIPKIEAFTKFGQNVYKRIDESKKKVVAVINGLALGGGLELALCADVILSVPKAVMAFPETGIGIYPGLGGTQRTQKRIGKGLTKYLIYTGKMINAKAAEQIGLVDAVIDLDEMFEILEGNKEVPVKKEERVLDSKWSAIKKFFESNTVTQIMNDDVSAGQMPEEEAAKLCKTIKRKAPLALKVAEKLIDEAKGPESELDHLAEIFSTSDALLGLSSIGKRVEFLGK
ncbi:putative 3-hydroxybutyryl-CoA dehydrogenase [bacterium BMS3Abin03]|nr:putative 3-hydroxybutyryl-CoA dehydrogenase [bacterium BMS3Abin03]